MTRYAWILLFLFALPFQGTAQSWSTALDQYFDKLSAKQKGMGSIAIFEKGKPIYQRAFGFANLKDSIPATTETRYPIGSVSKVFTAALIMKLEDEEKLSIHSPLSTYFPEIPNAEKITLNDLLRHKTGLANFTDAKDYEHWMILPTTREETLKRIIELGATGEPGTAFVYSNTNYMLLSFIAEEVTGMSFGEAMAHYITGPFGLDSTDVGALPLTTESYKLKAPGEWESMHRTHHTIPMGAGALVSTPSELCSFLYDLFAIKVVEGKSLNAMTTLEKGIGMGILEMPFYDLAGYGHTGGIDGFQSVAAFFPEDSLTIAYCTNAHDYPMNNILIAALSLAFDKPFRIPEFHDAVTLAKEDFVPYIGVYSSPSFPMKITISEQDLVLYVQATGQRAYPLEAYSKNRFRFDAANVEVEFLPGGAELMLRQNEHEFLLTKEEQ